MGNEDYSLNQYISENALKILKDYTIIFLKYTFETQEVAFKNTPDYVDFKSLSLAESQKENIAVIQFCMRVMFS